MGDTISQPVEWPEWEGPRLVEDMDKSKPSHSTGGNINEAADLETARQFF